VEKREIVEECAGGVEAPPIVVDSATLARLIEEVRHDEVTVGRAYDRTHNRHNR
jgi:hypothetical protein